MLDVNQVDGLQSTEEMHNAFACINRTGDFDSFRPIGNTLHALDRDFNPLDESLLTLLQAKSLMLRLLTDTTIDTL